MAIRFQLKWRSRAKDSSEIKTAEVLVSNEDVYLLRNGPAWTIGSSGVRRHVGAYLGGGDSSEYLRRVIMRPNDQQEVFHINGDILDCRRSNLVVIEKSEHNKYARARVEAA